MFQALQTLLAACASLTVSLVANDNGTITVTVIPKANKDGDNNASLNTPLVLTGTAEELDAEFAEIISNYSGKRQSLAEQLESTAAILEAAQKESASKATKAIKKGAATPAQPSAPDHDDEEIGDGDQGASKSTEGTAAIAAAPVVTQATGDAANLWG